MTSDTFTPRVEFRLAVLPAVDPRHHLVAGEQLTAIIALLSDHRGGGR
jgi:hypothetical protein